MRARYLSFLPLVLILAACESDPTAPDPVVEKVEAPPSYLVHITASTHEINTIANECWSNLYVRVYYLGNTPTKEIVNSIVTLSDSTMAKIVRNASTPRAWDSDGLEVQQIEESYTICPTKPGRFFLKFSHPTQKDRWDQVFVSAGTRG